MQDMSPPPLAQIAAEELGVTSQNVEEMARTSNNPDIQRLVGAQGDLGEQIGLTKKQLAARPAKPARR